MSTLEIERQTEEYSDEPFDSFDYCIAFWEGALDEQDEIDFCLREAAPRHARDNGCPFDKAVETR